MIKGDKSMASLLIFFKSRPRISLAIIGIILLLVVFNLFIHSGTDTYPPITPIRPVPETGSLIASETYEPLVYLLTKFAQKNDSMYLTVFLKREYSLDPLSRNFFRNWRTVKPTLERDYHVKVNRSIVDFIKGSSLDVRVEMGVDDFEYFVKHPPSFVEGVGVWNSPALEKVPHNQPNATEIILNSTSTEEAYNRTVKLYNTLYGKDFLEKYGDRILPELKHRINESYYRLHEGNL